MIIYLSYVLRAGLDSGCRAVSTDRQGIGRSAPVRDSRAHREAVRNGLPSVVRLFSGSAGDDLAPSEGVGERWTRGIATRTGSSCTTRPGRRCSKRTWPSCVGECTSSVTAAPEAAPRTAIRAAARIARWRSPAALDRKWRVDSASVSGLFRWLYNCMNIGFGARRRRG